jgi:hypothetical protein
MEETVEKKLKFETLLEKLDQNFIKLKKAQKQSMRRAKLFIFKSILGLIGTISIAAVIICGIRSFIITNEVDLFYDFPKMFLIIGIITIISIILDFHRICNRSSTKIDGVDLMNVDSDKLYETVDRIASKNKFFDRYVLEMTAVAADLRRNFSERFAIMQGTVTIVFETFWLALLHSTDKECEELKNLIFPKLPEEFVKLFNESVEELFSIQSSDNIEQDLVDAVFRVLNEKADMMFVVLHVLCKKGSVNKDQITKVIELEPEVLEQLFK